LQGRKELETIGLGASLQGHVLEVPAEGRLQMHKPAHSLQYSGNT
jgi:hypothetical protein